MIAAEAYPLSWPSGRPRTPAAMRRRALFSVRVKGDGSCSRKEALSMGRGLTRLREQLEMLLAARVVVSTNVPTRNDGLPYSKAALPKDPGVAVYFQIKGRPYCLACDRWDRLPDNMADLAAHIEALRGQDRWGVGSLEEAFAGHLALAAMPPKRAWWEVLGFDAGPPQQIRPVEERWVDLAREHHPDRGGSSSLMADINAARDEAERYYDGLVTRGGPQ